MKKALYLQIVFPKETLKEEVLKGPKNAEYYFLYRCGFSRTPFLKNRRTLARKPLSILKIKSLTFSEDLPLKVVT